MNCKIPSFLQAAKKPSLCLLNGHDHLSYLCNCYASLNESFGHICVKTKSNLARFMHVGDDHKSTLSLLFHFIFLLFLFRFQPSDEAVFNLQISLKECGFTSFITSLETSWISSPSFLSSSSSWNSFQQC